MKPRKINNEKRAYIRDYLDHNITLKRIAESLEVSRYTLYNELKRGLTEEQIEKKEWKKYDPELAKERLREITIKRIKEEMGEYDG